MFEATLSFIADEFVAFLCGAVGGWFYNVFYFWRLRRRAPSARPVGGNIIALRQKDYDALPKKKEGLLYMTTDEEPPSDLMWWERVQRFLLP